MREKHRVIMIEQVPLMAAPKIREPMERHHVSEIVSTYVDTPGIPIQQAKVATACVVWHEDIPDVRIAVHDRHIAMRVIALVQMGTGVDQALIKIAPLS